MPYKTFVWNLIKMTIMWSSVCFTTYLLHFQLKYLEGDMFTNNKFCAITDFMAAFLGCQIYKIFGLKKTYYLSLSIGIIGGLGVLYLESMHSEQQISSAQFYFFSKWMPICIGIAKFGIAISFLASYFASFIDNRIFPIEKRATAIGVCNICARSLTGLSPIISELQEPLPMVYFIALLFIALICNSTINLDEPNLKNKKSN